MTGDAKLGLLVGVGVVVAAALVYYRPEGVQAKAKEPATAAAAVKAEVGANYRTVQLSPARLGTPEE